MLPLIPVAALVGLGSLFWIRKKTKVVASTGAVFEETGFPWNPISHEGKNLVPELGRTYFLEVADRDHNHALVQGVWVGPKSNRKPGALRVQRVVDRWNTVDPFRLRAPDPPFTVEIFPSRLDLKNDFLIPCGFLSVAPSEVDEKPFTKIKPKPGTKVRFAVKECAPGNALFVMVGKVLSETPGNWPISEGLPDRSRVLVSWDRIERVVHGSKDAPLPVSFVLPVEYLISG